MKRTRQPIHGNLNIMRAMYRNAHGFLLLAERVRCNVRMVRTPLQGSQHPLPIPAPVDKASLSRLLEMLRGDRANPSVLGLLRLQMLQPDAPVSVPARLTLIMSRQIICFVLAYQIPMSRCHRQFVTLRQNRSSPVLGSPVVLI